MISRTIFVSVAFMATMTTANKLEAKVLDALDLDIIDNNVNFPQVHALAPGGGAKKPSGQQ